MTKYNKKRRAVRIKNFFKSIGIVMGGDKPVLNPRQKKMISIVRRAINNLNSKLTVDPILGSCYAECNNYFIILTTLAIEIYGESDSYTDIHYTVGDKLVNHFYKVVSERRIEKENSYKNKTLIKLNKIYIDVNVNQ